MGISLTSVDERRRTGWVLGNHRKITKDVCIKEQIIFHVGYNNIFVCSFVSIRKSIVKLNIYNGKFH